MKEFMILGKSLDENIIKENTSIIEDGQVYGNTPVGAEIIGEHKFKNKHNKKIVQTVLQDLEVMNRNVRFYTKPNMMCALREEIFLENLLHGDLKGEDGHPFMAKIERHKAIISDHICCKFLKLWVEDNLIKGLYVSSGIKGKYLEEDLEEGAVPAFSLRAVGGVSKVNGKTCVNVGRIITWDRVIIPSHKAARSERIIESASGNDGRIYECMEDQILAENFNTLVRNDSDLDAILESLEFETDRKKIKYESGRVLLTESSNGAKTTPRRIVYDANSYALQKAMNSFKLF